MRAWRAERCVFSAALDHLGNDFLEGLSDLTIPMRVRLDLAAHSGIVKFDMLAERLQRQDATRLQDHIVFEISKYAINSRRPLRPPDM